MREIAWACIGVFFGMRAWRLAHQDIHRLRQEGTTFGEAHLADLPIIVFLGSCLSGALWWALAQTFDVDLTVVVYGLWSMVLWRLLYIDIDTHVIPHRITTRATMFVMIALLFLSIIDDVGHPLEMLGGAVGLWVLLKLLEVMSRGGLGGGDVALAPLLGSGVGWLGLERIFVVLIVAFIAGGIWAIVLLALGRVRRTTFLAFGPFLIAGALVGVLR